jgi:hypothetical protein
MTNKGNLTDLAKTHLVMIGEHCRKAVRAIDKGRYDDAATDMKVINASINTAAGCVGRLMVSEPITK